LPAFLGNPSTARIPLGSSPRNDSSRAMNEERAHITIATLANAEQFVFATTGVLPRHEAEPGSQMTSILKGTRIGDGRDDGGSGQWPHSFNRSQSLAAFITGTLAFEFVVNSGHAGIQQPQLIMQRRKGRTSEGREVVGWILDESGKGTP
jgi:hypothetical protein